ncbi:MAG: crossover junction endodeoxyribonuclease RuvC [Deferribacteres bacterium]|nr:crossover junction endodeoxyribonuclease RuvC [Deferribacteres bacterium]
MRVLGIDPGSVRLGYAVFDGEALVDCGTVSLSGDMRERAYAAYRSIAEVLRRFAVSQVAMEKVFYGKNASSLIKLAQCRGAVLAALGEAGVELFEYHPSEVKKAITGNGSAPKSQVMWMVKALFSIDDLKSDAADAVAVAYCHISRMGCSPF